MERILLAVILLIVGLTAISHAYENTDFCEEYFKHGKIEQVIEACSTQIQNVQIHDSASKAKLANMYYYRGRAYEKKGDIEKAFTDLNKSLELNNKLYPANISLGMIYYNGGSPDKAIAQYNRAIELKPKSAYLCAIYTNRGNAYRAQDNFDQAISDYTRCIGSNPNNDSLIVAYTMRGTAYQLKGEYDLAIQDCNKAIELNPKFYPLYNQRGLAYYLKGNYDGAVTDFSNAITLQPVGVNSFALYANRGNALKAKGKFEEAITDYKKAIELNDKTPNVLYNLACTYSLIKRIPEACASLQKAIDRGYGDWDKMKNDHDLDYLRGSECYRKMMSDK